MISERASGNPPQYNTKIVKQFALITVVWGIVGMLIGVIIAAQLVWPELNVGPYLHIARHVGGRLVFTSFSTLVTVPLTTSANGTDHYIYGAVDAFTNPTVQCSCASSLTPETRRVL